MLRGWTTRQEQTIGLAPSYLRPRCRRHSFIYGQKTLLLNQARGIAIVDVAELLKICVSSRTLGLCRISGQCQPPESVGLRGHGKSCHCYSTRAPRCGEESAVCRCAACCRNGVNVAARLMHPPALASRAVVRRGETYLGQHAMRPPARGTDVGHGSRSFVSRIPYEHSGESLAAVPAFKICKHTFAGVQSSHEAM